MNKLTEQNLLKKSRFLKYSLLASISVGAIITIPFESMAMSKEAFRIDLGNKLLNNLSQLNGNKDTTNTPQQIGTVIVPESEINTYIPSEIREMEISNKPKASNPLKDVPIEDHYKKIARSKSDVGKARKVRPPNRSKTFVDSEKTERSQNTYTLEPTEQTPQKPEIIITASSPTVSPASNSFVTAPNTPSTTLTSPEYYTTAPSTPSTPATPYQPTPDSKPNDSVGVNTPPNTSSKVVQKLSFSSEPQQIVQLSKPTLPPRPITPVPLPIKKSSTEIAAGMVSNISRVNETIGIKLAEVTQAIKDTTGKKNKKPLQKLHTQLTSSQKTAKKLKSEAERIGQKIIALDEANTSLSDWNKKGGGIKNKHESDKDTTKVGKNNKEIEKLKKELVNRNSEADTLFQKIEKIDIPVNKVSIKSQGTVPVTTASTKVSAFQAQQARINEAQQDVLGQNQQHIAAGKTKKQRQAEDKQRTEREKKRKEENHQKEKARDIVEIREDIAKKMQSTMSGYSEILPKKLEELEIRVGNIKDKKKKQEAQKQLSEIKKQEKAIKTAADKAKEVAASAKKETSRTALRAMQDKMNGYSEQLNKIEENLKLLTPVVYNSSTGSTYKQPPKAKPTMPLSRGVQRILGEQLENEDGYLVSTKVQQQPYTVMLSSQEIEDPKSMDSGLGSLSNGTLGKETDEDAGFYSGWGNKHHKESSLSVDSGLTKKAAQLISLLDAKRTEILQTTSPSQQKSLNLALQEIENDKDYVDTYIRVLSNKIQKIEELPGSSSRSEELNHIKEAMAYISDRIQDVEELDKNMLLAINALLQEHDEKISSLLLEKYTSEEAEDILAQSLLQEMLVSDGKSESTLPTGDEEQEDTEVTDVSGKLSLLPVSSNEYALALSDGSEYEEDEESYDSGFEEEKETIEQLSDSDGGNLKITEVDTAVPLEQKAKKEMQTQILENAPTLNQAKVVNTIVNNMIRNRLDASMNMVAVGAGDEEESRIKRGLWMRGMYGVNNHGRVDNMTGYRGTNKGATIGFDVEIDNNILGIAYSNVHSVFKFKNSKNNDKELINSHVVSIYGQKELPRNFALQALVSASKNFIKDKTTYSYGDTKIRSNVKHRNHSYNAEALLNYNYLLQNKLVIIPNIGLRYGKSRDGVYNETGINVQEIALTMKENNILSGIVGTKVKVPLKDALKFNNLGLTFQGAVEHNFKEKTQRINRVVKIFDNTFKQDYLIPKQPKTSYNLGTGIIGSIKNTTISLDYNYYLNKHYRSHQGSVKLKVNL
ncbi:MULTISPECIES: autotransporter domain-containing protein [spotted fever group]|uniref:Cell surface antigen Sca1 n=2 Tax=cellular organisms TaxID=131567 RepID=A0A8E0WLZ4_9RICK|nr:MULTISPECIES: autotransporter domain-containing protein [spotted fever group]EER22733.1 autotransporter beta-domain protein [Rickettsia endosymbiont of Ixodes scapularis]KDO03103.1 cell surface antigen Sca1 [Rickettsia tamurae subsp. buchneri]